MKLHVRPFWRAIQITFLKRHRLTVVLSALSLLTVATAPAMADAIPYPNVGTPAPTNIFTAQSTGTINTYFYGSKADGTDYIEVVDTTQNTNTGWIFDNQTTAPGTEASLAVNAGDNIEFWIEDLEYPQEGILTSNPADSKDGYNHVYATPYSATGSTAVAGIPAGTFLGFEDVEYPESDFDYNDDTAVFTNLAVTPSSSVPEPASTALMLMGVPVIGYVGRRALKRA